MSVVAYVSTFMNINFALRLFQNDPEAHEKFLKITNIYEVLKDEELRKKYDRYGEEGLKEDFKGGRYESYNFYKDEFGTMDGNNSFFSSICYLKLYKKIIYIWYQVMSKIRLAKF